MNMILLAEPNIIDDHTYFPSGQTQIADLTFVPQVWRYDWIHTLENIEIQK